MIKVTNLQEMNHIENAALQMHIRKKAETMMQEYHKPLCQPHSKDQRQGYHHQHQF